jgi:hypothetical protein
VQAYQLKPYDIETFEFNKDKYIIGLLNVDIEPPQNSSEQFQKEIGS